MSANLENPVPGASVSNPAHDKVMRKEAWQTQGCDQASGVSPAIFWACTPKTKNLPAFLLCSSDILWKKSNQGFSLLHLKGMFQLNPLW